MAVIYTRFEDIRFSGHKIMTSLILLCSTCDQMVFGVKQEVDQTTYKNGALGLDNPLRNCAHELNKSQLKIFALDANNPN